MSDLPKQRVRKPFPASTPRGETAEAGYELAPLIIVERHIEVGQVYATDDGTYASPLHAAFMLAADAMASDTMNPGLPYDRVQFAWRSYRFTVECERMETGA